MSILRPDVSALRSRVGLTLLWLFLTVDAVLIGLHLLYTLVGTPDNQFLDLGVDRSYSEILMYVKFGWITVLTMMLARTRQSLVFAAVAAASLLLLIEDALILHERIGWYLNERILAILPEIRGWGILSVQIGELIWLGAISVLILGLFLIAYRRAEERDRRDVTGIALFFVVLGFFALAVDSIHSLFAFGSGGDIVFTVLEDGGELIALSPAVALAFALATRGPQDSTTISSGDLSGRSPRQRA